MQTSDFEKITKMFKRSKLLGPYVYYEVCSQHYNGEEYAVCYDDGYNKVRILFDKNGKIL